MQKVTKIDLASLGTWEASCTKRRQNVNNLCMKCKDVCVSVCNKSYTNPKGNQD